MLRENIIEIDECLDIFSLKTLTDIKDLKYRYRYLTKLFHPDRHPHNIELSTEYMQRLNRAYEILKKKMQNGNIVINHSRFKKREDYIKLIQLGDSTLRDVVILGWLMKCPRSRYSQDIKEKMANILKDLQIGIPAERININLQFYIELFSQFIDVLKWSQPKPLPKAWNSTQFFKHLKPANHFLESGIRDYYYYYEKNNLDVMLNIPNSYLDDANFLYKRLLNYISDKIYKESIIARIQLAQLFKQRLSDKGLRGV
jgi:hypothetical protein